MRKFHNFGAIVVIVNKFINGLLIKTTQICSPLFVEGIKGLSAVRLVNQICFTSRPESRATRELRRLITRWLMYVSSARLFYNLV